MTPQQAAFEIYHQVREGKLSCNDILALINAQREAQIAEDVKVIETAFCAPTMNPEQARGWFISALTGQLWMEDSLESWEPMPDMTDDEPLTTGNPGLGHNGMFSAVDDWE